MFTPLRKLQCLKQCILVRLVLAGMAVNGLIKYLNIKYLCVFNLPKKDENWYEPPGLRQEDDKKLQKKWGVEYGCLGALGNNCVQLKISQTSAILTEMPVISHKTLFYSLSTYGVNLDEFMFLGVQHRIQKTIFGSRCVLYI